MTTTYTTSSSILDLAGSMSMDGDTVTTYTSNALGAGIVTNLGGTTGLHFKVQFTKNGVTTGYHVSAHKVGPNYVGDDWIATANGAEPKGD
jgi:hypothetical protein